MLPLEPCRRLHFELIPHMNSKESDDYELTVPSFADVLCVPNDEEASCLGFQHSLWKKEEEGKIAPFHPSKLIWDRSSPGLRHNKTETDHLPVNEAAIKKSAALEDELTFLRSQIAETVAIQDLRESGETGFIDLSNGPSMEQVPPSAAATGLSAEPDHAPSVVLSPLLPLLPPLLPPPPHPPPYHHPLLLLLSFLCSLQVLFPCNLDLLIHMTWIVWLLKWKGSSQVLRRPVIAIIQKARDLVMSQTCWMF